MNKNRNLYHFLLIAVLVGLAILPALTYSRSSAGVQYLYPLSQSLGPVTLSDAAMSVEAVRPLSVRADRQAISVPPTTRFASRPEAAPENTLAQPCSQVLVNTKLDVIELGAGSGSAEPWVPLWQTVYYDDEAYVSPQHSLIVIIGDDNDSTPSYDGFGQGFIMPANLTSVTVDYMTAVGAPRSSDFAYGTFWSVNPDGTLNQELFFWPVGDDNQPLVWRNEVMSTNDPADMALLEEQWLALVFYNYTDETAPTPGEVTWFDDITLTVCTDTAVTQVFLPNVTQPGLSLPGCFPPTETPPDLWNANRGLVETSATCNSSMSSLDRQDYYSYKPTQAGNHTFYLENLPAGSEWSLTVFVDQVDYPPPIANNGNCRTTAPGSANKQVTCSLQSGQSYFIKVSAGSDYGGPVASYRMRVMGP